LSDLNLEKLVRTCYWKCNKFINKLNLPSILIQPNLP